MSTLGPEDVGGASELDITDSGQSLDEFNFNEAANGASSEELFLKQVAGIFRSSSYKNDPASWATRAERGDGLVGSSTVLRREIIKMKCLLHRGRILLWIRLTCLSHWFKMFRHGSKRRHESLSLLLQNALSQQSLDRYIDGTFCHKSHVDRIGADLRH